MLHVVKEEIGTVIEILSTVEKAVKETTDAKDAAATLYSRSEKRMGTRVDALKDV